MVPNTTNSACDWADWEIVGKIYERLNVDTCLRSVPESLLGSLGLLCKKRNPSGIYKNNPYPSLPLLAASIGGASYDKSNAFQR